MGESKEGSMSGSHGGDETGMRHNLLHDMQHESRMVAMNSTTAARKSVPLDADELTLAARVREPGTPEREAVESALGPLPGRLSEAQALSALLSLAQTSVREHVTSAGYAAYAAALDEEDRAFADTTRSRRAERARFRAEAGRE